MFKVIVSSSSSFVRCREHAGQWLSALSFRSWEKTGMALYVSVYVLYAQICLAKVSTSFATILRDIRWMYAICVCSFNQTALDQRKWVVTMVKLPTIKKYGHPVMGGCAARMQWITGSLFKLEKANHKVVMLTKYLPTLHSSRTEWLKCWCSADPTFFTSMNKNMDSQ